MRLFTALICSIASLLIASPGAQAAWPTRTVKVVVPAGPASATDRVTRVICRHLSKMWGQPVIVENKPGAVSMIGNNYVAKSKPDGYTLLSTFVGLVQTPAFHKHMPYNVEKSFAPVSMLITSSVLFMVPASSPYHTMKQFLAAAKTAHPAFDYGSPGVGHTYHIYGVEMAKATGVHLLMVPYPSEARSVQALLAGQLTSTFSSVGTGAPFVKAGKLRALGVVSKVRTKVLPNVPTFGQLGIPMPKIAPWFGVLAPAGTPRAIVNKISADIRTVLVRPDVVRFIQHQGMEPAGDTPQQFAHLIHVQLPLWLNLEREMGIKQR